MFGSSALLQVSDVKDVMCIWNAGQELAQPTLPEAREDGATDATVKPPEWDSGQAGCQWGTHTCPCWTRCPAKVSLCAHLRPFVIKKDKPWLWHHLGIASLLWRTYFKWSFERITHCHHFRCQKLMSVCICDMCGFVIKKNNPGCHHFLPEPFLYEGLTRYVQPGATAISFFISFWLSKFYSRKYCLLLIRTCLKHVKAHARSIFFFRWCIQVVLLKDFAEPKGYCLKRNAQWMLMANTEKNENDGANDNAL